MDDIVQVCPFCLDPITNDLDYWFGVESPITSRPLEYVCPGCGNGVFVNRNHAASGVLPIDREEATA
jgi:hypothetical protein